MPRGDLAIYGMWPRTGTRPGASPPERHAHILLSVRDGEVGQVARAQRDVGAQRDGDGPKREAAQQRLTTRQFLMRGQLTRTPVGEGRPSGAWSLAIGASSSTGKRLFAARSVRRRCSRSLELDGGGRRSTTPLQSGGSSTGGSSCGTTTLAMASPSYSTEAERPSTARVTYACERRRSHAPHCAEADEARHGDVERVGHVQARGVVQRVAPDGPTRELE